MEAMQTVIGRNCKKHLWGMLAAPYKENLVSRSLLKLVLHVASINVSENIKVFDFLLPPHYMKYGRVVGWLWWPGGWGGVVGNAV